MDSSSLSSSFITSALPNQLHHHNVHNPRTRTTTISAVRTDANPPSTTTATTNPKQAVTDTTRTTSTSTSTPTPTAAAANSRTTLPSPQRRPQQQPSFAFTVCNALDTIINTFIDTPPRPSVDPRHVLSGDFAPVDELPPVPCPVIKGSIPPCLGGGAYIRNGPNPQHLPRGPHHLFDGDGMLHTLLLPPGGGRAPATFSSRFVRTYKYLLERDAGVPVLPSVFGAFHGLPGIARGAVLAARTLTGQTNILEGIGLANTSLFYFDNRLFALGESDLPYAVHLSPDDGDMSTVGRYNFDGKLSMGMTAHPKKDPRTGEAFAFRYGPVPPFLTYFWFDKEGNKQPDVPVFSMGQPSFLHDFAITERHAIFADIQMVMNPMDMVFGGGSPVGSDPGKVPKIGVMPRYAASEREMRWFEAPGFNPVHTINAWDEGDAIVLVAPNVLSVEHALERMELVHSCVEMVRIDLRDGTVSRTPVSAGNFDFPVINPAYTGRKNRYAYAGIGYPMPKISGVAKLDFEAVMSGPSSSTECVVASRRYGEGCFGGEPFFVAKGDINDGDLEEDDGYVMSYVHNEISGESKFVVMEAKSPDLEIVAEVLLPRRVPYGFHGLFVGETDIKNQQL